MHKNQLTALAAALLLSTSALTACGSDGKKSHDDSAAAAAGGGGGEQSSPAYPELATGKALLLDNQSSGENADDPYASPSASSGTDTTGTAYAIDDAQWQVTGSTAAPQRYASDGKQQRQAPEGSVLVKFSIKHAEPTYGGDGGTAPQETEKSTTFTLTSGGKTISLPKPDPTGSMDATWLASVPGDGKDAAVNIVAAKGTQTIKLIDGQLSGITAGWTPDKSGGSVSSQPLTSTTECDDSGYFAPSDHLPEKDFAPVKMQCNVSWHVTPYLPDRGWAGQGSQWWVAKVHATPTTITWWANEGRDRQDYVGELTITDGKLDGTDKLALADSHEDSQTYQNLTFRVKDDTFPSKLTLTAKGTGRQGQSNSSDAPKSWSNDNIVGSVSANK